MTATQRRPVATPGGLAALATLCVAQFMLIIDVVVVNVALPTIAADLDISEARLQLIAVAYTVTFGSLLIVFGRAGDVYGRRRLFLVGMSVFTIASLGTGLAGSEVALIAGRAAQGVGAAMVSPTALALLLAAFPEGAGRNRASVTGERSVRGVRSPGSSSEGSSPTPSDGRRSSSSTFLWGSSRSSSRRVTSWRTEPPTGGTSTCGARSC